MVPLFYCHGSEGVRCKKRAPNAVGDRRNLFRLANGPDPRELREIYHFYHFRLGNNQEMIIIVCYE